MMSSLIWRGKWQNTIRCNAGKLNPFFCVGHLMDSVLCSLPVMDIVRLSSSTSRFPHITRNSLRSNFSPSRIHIIFLQRRVTMETRRARARYLHLIVNVDHQSLPPRKLLLRGVCRYLRIRRRRVYLKENLRAQVICRV